MKLREREVFHRWGHKILTKSLYGVGTDQIDPAESFVGKDQNGADGAQHRHILKNHRPDSEGRKAA